MHGSNIYFPFPQLFPSQVQRQDCSRACCSLLDAERYLHSLWELLGRGMQEHVALVRQVHVDAVGTKVVGHRQLVVAVVTHLLHDLQ